MQVSSSLLLSFLSSERGVNSCHIEGAELLNELILIHHATRIFFELRDLLTYYIYMVIRVIFTEYTSTK